MYSAKDYSNSIDKIRLKLDYEKYDQDTPDEFSYNKENPYKENESSVNNSVIKLPDLDYDSLINTDYSLQNEESDNDDYQNKGGNRKVLKAMEKTTGEDYTESGAFGSINGKGSGLADNAGGIAQYGMQQVDMFSNVAGSEKESWASLGGSTLNGAALGMSVGGPIGAAIGGTVGAVTGVVDMIGDIKKRNESARQKHDDLLNLNTTKRKQDYKMQKGEESVNKLMQLRKAQLNYINPEF